MRKRLSPNPPIIPSPEKFCELADQYLDECEQNNRRPTVPGMARALGFATRQSIHDYKKRDEYKHCVQAALLELEDDRARRLMDSPAGLIFDLCNNFGWMQPTQIQHLSGPHGGPIEVSERKPMPPEVANELESHTAEIEGE